MNPVKSNIGEKKSTQLESKECQNSDLVDPTEYDKNPIRKTQKVEFFFFAYPMRRKKRGVIVTEEVLEESFEIEASASAREMPEAVDDGLRVFFGGLLLPLHFHEKPFEMRRCHELILGVLLEEGLDLRRRLRQRQLEPPSPAEAHAVCLLRSHASLLLSALCSLWVSLRTRICACVSALTLLLCWNVAMNDRGSGTGERGCGV